MAPHTPQRSSRPGEPVALLDRAGAVTHRWGGPKWPPTPPSARRAPGNPWRSSIALARGLIGGGPRNGPPHPPTAHRRLASAVERPAASHSHAPRGTRGAPRSRARWLKSHHLVGPRGGLAEASHRVRGQPRVDLVQAQVDLAVGEREEAGPPPSPPHR